MTPQAKEKFERAQDFVHNCSLCGTPADNNVRLVVGFSGSVCNLCADELPKIFKKFKSKEDATSDS